MGGGETQPKNKQERRRDRGTLRGKRRISSRPYEKWGGHGSKAHGYTPATRQGFKGAKRKRKGEIC